MATPTFIAKNETDAAILRRLGARVWCVGDRIGGADGDVVLVARSGGRELLMGMNLAGTGRFLDLAPNASLETITLGHPDPSGLLDEMAHDVYWHEERPLSAWSVPEQPKAQPCGFDFLHAHLRWAPPELGSSLDRMAAGSQRSTVCLRTSGRTPSVEGKMRGYRSSAGN